MSQEWEGLPRPEGIDAVAHTWTMTLEERMALDEMRNAERNGRLRLDRYQQWICDKSGVPHWVVLQILVELPHRNS